MAEPKAVISTMIAAEATTAPAKIADHST